MRNICVAILMLLLTAGCSIPIRVIQVPVEDPKVVRAEERAYQEKLRLIAQKEKTREARLKAKIAKKQEEKTLLQDERSIILKSFGESALILKSFEKMGLNIFDIGTFLNEYGKEDFDGFCEFLKTKYPLNTKVDWFLEREIFTPARRNYKLLKRMSGDGKSY